MWRRTRLAFYSLLILSLGIPLFGFPQIQERFPKPDFQSGYVRPDLLTPTPRSPALEYLDVVILLAALALATYLAHKLRSRRSIFLLMVFCLAYFGFFRKGCICPIGSVQNVGLALFDSGYAIPLTALAFFLLPLLFGLFFGRTFCAAVCPLGAVQDLMVLRPVQVPTGLGHTLGVLPYVYLGLAVLFAATGAGFVICQYDPFVGFFRFGARFDMVLLGASLLLLGTVVARPYCRFLCPYGVLLNWVSRLSRKHVRITPTECINCRLCEESCPFGAIKMASEPAVKEPASVQAKRIAVLLLLLPAIVLGSGWVASRMYVPLARKHSTVALAESITAENRAERTEMTDATLAFRASGKPTAELMAEAKVLQERFRLGGWFMGGFLGLALGMKLVGFSIPRRQPEYDVDTGNCLSCARCFAYCPFEQVRMGLIGLQELEEIKSRTREHIQDDGKRGSEA